MPLGPEGWEPEDGGSMFRSWTWEARALLVACICAVIVLLLWAFPLDGDPSAWARCGSCQERVRVDGKPLYRLTVHCPNVPEKRFVSVGEWDVAKGYSVMGFTDYATMEKVYTSCPIVAEPVLREKGKGGPAPSAEEILNAAESGGREGKAQ